MRTTSTIDGTIVAIASETTPLIVASEANPTTQTNGEASLSAPSNNHQNEDDEEDKPLPKFQIFLLCYARLVEPIAFFSIFPFINKMIFETGGIEEAKVGFYAGLIESLFSLTQMCLMLPWGRAADKYGRKPVLVFSLFGVAVATALFGLSQKIWQMMLFRCLAGVFAGTVVTIRSMISEHSTPKTQARAFSYFAFAGNLGLFLGPLIGGALADPAKEYKSVFGGIQFFENYPYALPTFVTGFIGLTAAIVNALFVTETLTADLKASNKASPHASMTAWELLKFPGVINVVIIYGYTMLLGLAYTAVAPLFWFTSISLGGLGFSPIEIALFLGLGGISQALWILFAFPPLHRRIGTGALLRLCAFVWVLAFAAWPFANKFLKNGWVAPFWTLAVIFNIVGSGVSMAFTAVQLALNDIAPSHATLGTLNALALGLVAGTRAVAPAAFASTFAIGVKKQIFGGYLIWVVLIALAVGENVFVRWLPANVEGKVVKKPVDEEEEEAVVR